MLLMIKTAAKSFTSLWQTHPLKKGTETVKETLNTNNMRIVPNRLNISGN